MKKTLAFLLAALMLLGMAACSKSSDKAQAAEITAEPTAAPTPAPTEVPADLIVGNAFKKLDEAKSMHMDMDMVMDMTIQIEASDIKMSMPMKMDIDYGMDIQKEEQLAKAALSMSLDMAALGQQSNAGVIYIDMRGDKPVSYFSDDEGATWTVDTDNEETAKLQDSYTLLQQYGKDFEKTGADTVDGKAVTVYAGKLDGQYAQQIMEATGMTEVLSSVTNTDEPTEETAPMGDIPVTVSIDDASGYPVFYSMDMADLFRDVLIASLKEAMGADGVEDMNVTLDLAALKSDCTLSQFNSVAPIEIPEAALAANNN